MFTSDDFFPKSPLIYNHYQNLGLQIYPRLDNLDGRINTHRTKKYIDFNKIINEYYLPEEDAREALYKFVDNHCCYGKNPVKKLKFNKLETSNYYRYVLQTFTESRSTSYASEPYFYDGVDKKTCEPDNPWNIKVRPKSLFKEETIRLEVPNTSHIECCTNCSGIGTNLCHTCHGRTYKYCSYCNGTGYSLISSSDAQDSFSSRKYYTENYSDMYAHNPLYNTNSQNQNNHNYHHNYHDSHSYYTNHASGHFFHNTTCAYCGGNGTEICHDCVNGRVGCRVCDKSGYLRWFIELEVKYENNFDDYLKKVAYKPLSDDLIRNCVGEKIFSEKKSQITPIDSFPEKELNKASKDLVRLHLSKFSHCRILAQRHEIFCIPVTICTYQWKKKLYRFSVYGLDQQVYSPDYPSKCSCCNIL